MTGPADKATTEPEDGVTVRLDWDRHAALFRLATQAMDLEAMETLVVRAQWIARWCRYDTEGHDELVESAKFGDVRDAVSWGMERSAVVEVSAGWLGAFEGTGLDVLSRLDVDSPPVPPGAPEAARQEMEVMEARQRTRERDNQLRDASSLRNAREASRLSVEQLAALSGIDAERVSKAEVADPPLELTLDEWVRLALALDGLTWDEYVASHRRKVGWVAGPGHMLQAARQLVRDATGEDPP